MPDDAYSSAERPTASAASFLPFRFTGTGHDYFSIWIVNLLLSIITIGVWSAWAKVRRLRYFYGNTILHHHGLDYHATGWMILKGRLIAVAVLIAYSMLEFIDPLAQGIAALAAIPVLPWLIIRSLKFNARMTSWRNVRFDFQGRYWPAFKAFIVMPVLGVVTLGLLMPLTFKSAALYLARNFRFGQAEFQADARLGDYYVAVMKTSGVFIGALAILGATFGALTYALHGSFSLPAITLPPNHLNESSETDIQSITQFTLAITIAIVLSFVIAKNFLSACNRNIIVNGLRLDDRHEFTSNLSGFRLAWIALSNLIMKVLSLGLLTPWATIRTWRYQTHCLSVLAAGNVDDFVDTEQQSGSAFGSEFADLQDFDIGL
ncbi:MAG: DUF898 domain-containing protein [Hyphomicrobiales bacterium]|nr:DUF898 domain-containing protein [Hyphomicrobiales bacterium]